MDPAMLNQVRHLYEVERLSQRQIAQKLGISRKRVSRLLHPESSGIDPWGTRHCTWAGRRTPDNSAAGYPIWPVQKPSVQGFR